MSLEIPWHIRLLGIISFDHLALDVEEREKLLFCRLSFAFIV